MEVGEAISLGGGVDCSALMVGDEDAEPPLFRLDPVDEIEFFRDDGGLFEGLALDGVGEEDPLEGAPPLASGSPLDRLRLLKAGVDFPFLVGKPRPIGMLEFKNYA